MKILLDTHAFLWFFEGDERLSTSAREAIESEANENLLSVASLWEIAIKTSIGKLRLTGPFGDIVSRAMNDVSVTVVPITMPHLVEVSTMHFHHRDPFDRLLAAQAKTEGLTIVSGDECFEAYGTQRPW